MKTVSPAEVFEPPPQRGVSGYEAPETISDGEVPVLEIWETWSNPSLPLLIRHALLEHASNISVESWKGEEGKEKTFL